MMDQTLTLPDGRRVGFSDFGTPGHVPVLWCHGGPGSRLDAAAAGQAGQSLGLRIIGIDRPGYGLSSPNPGRSIGGWITDGLAVADRLGLDQFLVAGSSTGGAYALALAAKAPDRVLGVVAGCAMTDMRYPPARASMPGPATQGVWGAPDRATAMAIVADTFGHDGGKMMSGLESLPPADLATISDPAYLAGAEVRRQAMFAHGVQGYADDRIADGPGWVSFDPAAITCPVILVHGESDTIVPVLAAHHTASLIPEAELRLFTELGHLSVGPPAMMALAELALR